MLWEFVFIIYVALSHYICSTTSIIYKDLFSPQRTIRPTAGCVWGDLSVLVCVHVWCGAALLVISVTTSVPVHVHECDLIQQLFLQLCSSGVYHWPVCRISQVDFHRWCQGGQLWSASPLSCWKVKADKHKTPILAPLQSPAGSDTHQTDIEPAAAARAVV